MAGAEKELYRGGIEKWKDEERKEKVRGGEDC
jgi:hypothetical protein